MRYSSRTDRQKMVVDIEIAQQIQSEVAADAAQGLTNFDRIKNEWKSKGFYASDVNITVNEAIKELKKVFA